MRRKISSGSRLSGIAQIEKEEFPMTENETNVVQSKPKSLTGLYLLLVVVLIISLAGTGLSTALYLRTTQQTDTEAATEDTQEDGVTIAGEYVIRPTTNISDAYKSGDTSGLDDKEKETLDMAAAVLDEIITDGMTDYEKEKAVYDWMTSELDSDSGLLSVIPTTQADCDNPYGVLKYHNAVCVGYATTFRLFMQMMDIPCMVVHNTEEYHSWDLVQLDGEWYHTDIYSDAGNGESYAHFNRTDSMVLGSGETWDLDYFPSADSLTYNVLYNNAVEADNIYEIPALLREVIDNGETALALKFSSDLTEEQAEIADEMVSRIESLLGDEAYFLWDWSNVDDGYLYTISVNYLDFSTSFELSDEDYERMEAAITESFGDYEDDSDWDWDDYENYDWDDDAVG
jgi:hypothetical protein